MRYEVFIEKCQRNSVILLCGYNAGAGIIHKKLEQEIPECRIIPVDNSEVKQKKNGGQCISPDEAAELYPNGYYVIVPISARTSLSEQLMQLGIDMDRICMDIPDEIAEEDEAQLAERNLTVMPKGSFHFEVNVVRHCNLKCKGCNHYSPIAKEKYEDPLEYEQHFRRLSELFDGEVESILLLGGEPLLHPKLTEFMRTSRENFPKTFISVMTNGILLKQQKDDFWEACREYNVVVFVTRYPLDIDYEELKEYVENRNVRFSMVGGTEISARTLWYEPKDITGSKDPKWQFSHCPQANRCYTLEGSKLFGCVTIPGIPTLNGYFNLNMDISDKDSIDIYEAVSAEEIMEFFAKPYPFCRYCDWEHQTVDNPWELSKCDIGEWT